MSIISQTTISNIIPPPGLQEATKNSTTAWQEHLEELFRDAKDRFPDVVWEVGGLEEGEESKEVDEVWGHKAIVYARAPPSFQTRYFSFRQPMAAYPVDYPDESESIQPRTRTPSPTPSSTTMTTTTAAQAPPPTTSLLRLTSSINSTLFSNELEYLYTGKGFGEAFEFLFDSSEPVSRDHHHHLQHKRREDGEDPEGLRIDKLRKDLVFMWRSRLYSDVRIALTGNFSSSSMMADNTTTAIFSSHRFILVSRSPYFKDALLNWPKSAKILQQQGSEEPPTLNLPSPPFTPASLHFTLGFIYTGTLVFSHRSYDLSTAFAILRAALYLSLTSLHDEIQARIVQEMLHGLFHAFISFEEYERLTGGKWGTGGCRCRQCARRVPRVLEFAIADDVMNRHLERGARRALVGLFGEGWVNQEFAALPMKTRDSVLKGLAKRTTAVNVFPLLFAAEHALGKLGVVIEPWGDVSREMVMSARRTVEDVLCKESEACFGSDEWMELMEADGVRFEDGEKVEWAMAAVLRGVKDSHAASLYQTLVSSILLRPHPTDVNAPLLPATSHVRVQVEQTRLELLKWIGKRWLSVRQERGFDPLEGWALKEISDHIEVPIEDLLNPTQSTKNQSPKRQGHLMAPNTSLLRPASHHPHTSKVDAESDVASSMRVSVLSRSMPSRQNSTTATGTTSSSASSVRSAVRTSSDSFASAMSGNTIGATRQSRGGMSAAKKIVREARAAGEMKDRPDSKLTPSVLSFARSRTPSPSLMQPSILEPEVLEEEEEERMEDDGQEEEDDYESRNGDDSQSSIQEEPTIKKVLITRASLASVTSRSSTLSSISSMRPKSSASSVRSTTTLRKSVASSQPPKRTPTKSTTTRPVPSPTSRPTSNLSSTTDSTYRTASTGGLRTSPITRSRRTSGASTVSARTSPVGERKRRMSGGSMVSNVSVRSGRTISTGKRVPQEQKKLGVVGGSSRPGSGGSGSAASNSTPKKVVVKKKSSGEGVLSSSAPKVVKEVEVEEKKEEMNVVEEEKKEEEPEDMVVEDLSFANTSSTITIKPKERPSVEPVTEHKKTSSAASVATLKRKGSSDTIKTVKSSPPAPTVVEVPPAKQLPPTPSPPPPTYPPLHTQSSTLKPPNKIQNPGTPIVPQGATLEIGIPCIIASKRKRFKAYARYIGEVEGEVGAWVGVEVPIPFGDSGVGMSEDSKMMNNGGDERQWNDGSWGGVRYFEMGGMEWDDAARRRRLGLGMSMDGMMSWGVGGDKGVLKREGEQLSVGEMRRKKVRSVSPAVSEMSGVECRGLFVRPQQVLYVVDAVGVDL